jgi:NitT/TauT family transport system ATP-binding protein
MKSSNETMPSSDDLLLEISELGKIYPHKPKPLLALNELNLKMVKGEIVSVVGPSGCGKTTLLRLIAGLIQPSNGKITVSNMSPVEFCQSGGISFVFQKPVLFPWRTVTENLILAAEIHKNKPLDSDFERVNRLLEITGLYSFKDAYPQQLSGGMFQRAALARALMIRPQLLLLDEPLCALDEITREQLWFDFSKIWDKQNLSILLVTHSIREALFFGDRILLMSKRPGKIHASFEVPFDRPREHTILASAKFMEFYEMIRGELS